MRNRNQFTFLAIYASLITIFLSLAGFLGACLPIPDSFNYVCSNGTPETGRVAKENTQRCSACGDGYNLTGDTCTGRFDYVCSNGTPEMGKTGEENTQRCTACSDRYVLMENTCVGNFDYVCSNGTPETGKASEENTQRCTACNNGYMLTGGGGTCVSPIAQAEGNPGMWRWIPIDGMRCRDGSGTGIGVRLSSETEQKKLLIYYRGGNACFNQLSCEATPYKYDETDFTDDLGRLGGIFNEGMADNPFRDWHKVFVPYCTGDVHGGSLTANSPLLPLLVPPAVRQMGVDEAFYTGGLFTGYTNGQRVSTLAADYFKTQKEVDTVVLAGSSAGGFGVYMHYDQTATAFGEVPVTAIVDASPIFDAGNLVPGCAYGFVSQLWGLRFPDDYDARIQMADGDFTQHRLGGMYRYLTEKYPARQFGLLSHTQDAVIRLFYALMSVTAASTVTQLAAVPDDQLALLGVARPIPCPMGTVMVSVIDDMGMMRMVTVPTAGADIVDEGGPRINPMTYSTGLDNLRLSFTGDLNNWRVYYDDTDTPEDASNNQGHTFLFDNAMLNNKFYDTRATGAGAGNRSVFQWVNELLAGTAVHATD